MKLLIDADHLVYSCGFAADKHKEGFQAAEYNIRNQIYSMIHETQVYEYQLYLTGKGNFRNAIAKLIPYKGNRISSNKPSTYYEVREWLKQDYNAIMVEGLEADDLIAREGFKNIGNVVICSIDKDLNQVPGKHYNYLRKVSYEVSDSESLRNYFTQCITGDRVDNIPGLYGFGKQKVLKLFENALTFNDYYTILKNVYQQHAKIDTKTGKYKPFKMTLKTDVKINSLDDVENIRKEVESLIALGGPNEIS